MVTRRMALVSTMYSPFQVELARAINQIPGIEYHCFFTVEKSANRGKHWLAELSDESWIHKSPPWSSLDELRPWVRRRLQAIDPEVIIRTGILRSPTFRVTNQLASAFPGVPMACWLEHPDTARPLAVRLAIEAVARLQLRAVPLIMAIGDRAQAYYRRVAPHAKIPVVPYGQDLAPNYAIERSAQPREIPRFLFSGQLVRRNNIPRIVGAFERLARTHAGRFRFVVAANGVDERHIFALMNRSPMFSRAVEFDRQYSSWDERLRPFRNSDVLLAPYLHAGWCLVVPEAMAAGMPVIATRHVSAARHLVRDGHNGFLVGTDVDSIYRAMVRFVEDPASIRTMGAAARQAAHFSDAHNIAERFVAAALDAGS